MANNIYESIATRTDGSVYIGVVGPVRTGKSTFIKRFMENLVIPNIENEYVKERAKDELPQSGSGRMIMTSEPKFVPEDAVSIVLDDGCTFSVRLIDCVGYMINGAIGSDEEGVERKVTTPWFDHEIPMSVAAETGTKKVITEHSTIGIVVTTDGTVTEFDREDYVEAESRVISELKEIGKPFVILINSANPNGQAACDLKNELSEKYGVSCIVKDCMNLTEDDIVSVIKTVLYEFPISDVGITLPAWVDALRYDNPIKKEIIDLLLENMTCLEKIYNIDAFAASIKEGENVQSAVIKGMDLSTGKIELEVDVKRELFYATLSTNSGIEIKDDGDLVKIIGELSKVKKEYGKVAAALNDVRTTGYGIVFPDKDELVLQEPEIVKHGGRYSVRLKASAPSIHMIMANVETEVSPAVGGEKASGDIINYLLQEFEGDTGKIWESNIFGKSLYDIAGEGLNTKIKYMPEESQKKLRETLERIINEGSTGLICIIL